MIRRWFTLFVTLLLGATFLTACTSPAERDSSEQPRVLTQEESERLATSRWRNVDAGTRTFTTTLTAEGQTLDVTGLINFTTHTGTAAMGVDGASDAQLVAWDVTLVRVHPAVEGIDPTVGEAPPVDSDQWQSRPLDAAATAVDALLLVLLSSRLRPAREPSPAATERDEVARLRHGEWHRSGCVWHNAGRGVKYVVTAPALDGNRNATDLGR